MAWIMMLLMAIGQGAVSQETSRNDGDFFPTSGPDEPLLERRFDLSKAPTWNKELEQAHELCGELRASQDGGRFCKKFVPMVKNLSTKQDVTDGFYHSYPRTLYRLVLETIEALPAEKARSKELFYCQAIVYRKMGDAREAVRKIEAALVQAPNEARLLAERGTILLSMENYVEAKKCFEKALAADAKCAEANLGMALAMAKLTPKPTPDEIERVRTFLRKAVECDPENALAHYYLAINDELSEKNYQSLATMVKLTPYDTRPNLVLTLAAMKSGNARDAVIGATKLIECCPYFARYYQMRAVAYQELKELDKAKEDAKLAWLLTPDDMKAVKLLAGIYFVCEEYPEAITVLNHGLLLDKNDAHFYFLRGDCYFLTEMYRAAEKDLTKAIELQPNFPKAYVTRAMTRYFQKRYYAAEQDCRHALKQSPRDEQALFQLGTALLHSERCLEAADCFTKLIEWHPKPLYYEYRRKALDALEQEKSSGLH